MSSVDQRVVSMGFDNKQFEQGVSTTITSLKQLDSALDLSKSAKGLSEVSDAAKNFSISNISDGVDTLTDRFSNLGIIGITVIQNLVNSIIDMGTKLASSLSIDPILDGFSKFEQKTNSVQTILNATGLPLEAVNAEMSRLLWFADETSYSFTDMINNVGKFTAMGVPLNTATTAMQGIATWAALSGANATTATRAMYNLSQAMGVGQVTMIDWKSIENAQMATAEFKQTVIDTAVEMGTLKKIKDKTYLIKGGVKTEVNTANFGSTLGLKWFKSDVLMKSLDKYGAYADEVYRISEELGIPASEAMELVSKSFEEVGIRGFKAAQEAKTFTDAIIATKEAVASGWMRTFEIIFGDFYEAKELWTDFTGLLWDVFAAGAIARNELLQLWKDDGGRDDLIEGFWNLVDAIGAIVAPIKEAFSEIFPPATAEQLLKFTDGWKKFTEFLKMGETASADLKSTFKGLFAIVDIGFMALSAIADIFLYLVKQIIPAGDGILNFTGGLGDMAVKLRDAIESSKFFEASVIAIKEIIEPTIEFLKDLVTNMYEFGESVFALIDISIVTDAIKGFSDGLQSIFGIVRDKVTPSFEIVRGGVIDLADAIGGIGAIDLSSVDKFSKDVADKLSPVKNIGAGIKAGFTGVSEAVNNVLPVFGRLADGVGRAFATLKSSINSSIEGFSFDSFFTILNGGILIALVVGLKKLKDKINSVVSGKEGPFKSIIGLLDGVKDSMTAWQQSIKSEIIMKIATAMAVLSVAVIALSMVDPDRLRTALAAITLLFADLMVAMNTLNGEGATIGSTNKTTIAMIGLSTAVLILSTALTKIAQQDSEDLAKGLLVVTALLFTLSKSAQSMATSSDNMVKAAFGMFIFSAAIQNLAGVVKKLSELDLVDMGKGMLILGALMTEMSLFMNKAKFEKIDAKTGAGFLLMAGGITILVKAIETLAGLDPLKMAVALAGLAIILKELSIFVNTVDDLKSIASTSAGILLISGAMVVLAGALMMMGSMPIGQLASALLGLTVSLGAFGILLNVLDDAKNLLTTAGAIIILATAISILTPALMLLGSMKLESLGIALLAIAGVMVIFGVALTALALVGPALVVAAVAIGLLAGSFILLGLGMSAVAAGLLALGAVGVVAAEGLIFLFTTLLDALAAGIVAFAKRMAESAPVFAEAVYQILLEIVKTLLRLKFIYVSAWMEVILSFMKKVRDIAPEIVALGMEILLAFLKGVASKAQAVTEAAIDIINAITAAFTKKMPDIVAKGFELLVSFINAMADGVTKYAEKIRTAVKKLIDSILNFILGETWEIIKAGKDLMLDLIQGFIDGAVNIFKEGVQIGKNLINGMKDGITSLATGLLKAAKSVVTGAVDGVKKFLGIHSPSTLMKGIGTNFGKGMVLGIEGMSGDVSKSSKNVAVSAVENVKNAMAKIGEIMIGETDFDPVIKPVLDLSEMDKGLNSLNSAFDEKRGITLSTANIKAASISNQLAMAGVPSGLGGSSYATANYNIKLDGTYHIREEADIKKISQELALEIERKRRA